jgi:hypothetical protein
MMVVGVQGAPLTRSFAAGKDKLAVAVVNRATLENIKLLYKCLSEP